MKTNHIFRLFAPLALLLILLPMQASLARHAAPSPAGWSDGSLLFVENVGQFDPRARFQVRGDPDDMGTESNEGNDLAVRLDCPKPLSDVGIDGPTSGYTGTLYAFTATIVPTDATEPISYTWTPVPPGSAVLPGQSVATYTWDSPGTHTLTVTAENCGGSRVATHTITIEVPQQTVYLPLVMRDYEPPPVPDRYVKRYGNDEGDCSTPETACGSIQYALDHANAGDLIGIAGYSNAYAYPGDPDGDPNLTYWQTEARPKPEGYYGPDEVWQVAYISKTVTLRGGYSADFTTWDPDTYKTVLRPGLSGFSARVVLVAPGASPTLEWMYILEGDATDMGGAYNPFYDYESAGGGIAAIGTFNGNDTLIVRNCVIAGNIASTSYMANGGGVYLEHRDNATLTDNTIYSNIADYDTGFGGGINVTDSDNVVIRSNTVYSNVATTDSGRGEGAGIRASSADNLQITSNEIYSNTGNDNGGGIHVRASKDIQINGNAVYNNIGAQYQNGMGGGIDLFYIQGALVQNNAIYSNTATTSSSSDDTGLGGGVYVDESSDIVVSNNVITGNVANLYHSQGSGGGISLFNNQDVLVSQNIIRGNVSAPSSAGDSKWGGGGVRVSFGTDATLINNIIAQNEAPDGGDGIFLMGTSSFPVAATLLHNTLADNGTSEGILVGAYTTLTGTNTIVSGHATGISISYPVSSTVTMDYTLWYSNTSNYSGGVTDTNSCSGDPAFANPAGWDYHIGSGSTARDAGINAGVTTDIDGDSRPQGSGYDIGADEYK